MGIDLQHEPNRKGCDPLNDKVVPVQYDILRRASFCICLKEVVWCRGRNETKGLKENSCESRENSTDNRRGRRCQV